MPPLPNVRHEKFVQALLQGESANAAYQIAGYRPHDGNCIRLRGNERVKARLAELHGQAAKANEITIESICRELDEANAVAKERGQAAAMVSASTLRAKLGGLMVERVEVGSPGDFSEAETFSELADKMLDEIEAGFHPVSDEDHEGLTDLLERQGEELGEFLASIKARPVNGYQETAADVRWREFKARRRHLDLERDEPRLLHSRD